MNKDIRKYKEMDDIKENEVMCTIEYCTNCSSH